MSPAPAFSAAPRRVPLDATSGTNRNSGTEPSSIIAAAIGATMRSVWCVAGSSPNSGWAGMNPHATLPGSAKAQTTNASVATDSALTNASAAPDAAPARAMPAAGSSSALWKVSDTLVSQPISARMTSAAVTPIPPCGVTHHSAASSGTISATVTASPGLRGPMRSTAAPSSGTVSSTSQPAYFAAAAISCWPRTGSPMTSRTK